MPDLYGMPGLQEAAGDMPGLVPPVPSIDAFRQQHLQRMQAQRQAAAPAPEPAPDITAAPPSAPAPQQPFVDWPSYLQMRQGADPAQAYDEYVNGVLANQSRAMGATPAQVKQTQDLFRQQVPPPTSTAPKDEGIPGNAWTAVKQEIAGLGRQAEAGKAVATGDAARLAELAAEEGKDQPNAPQQRFREAIGQPSGIWDLLSSSAKAAVKEPQGAFDSTLQMLAGFAPYMAAGAAGGLAGSAVPVVGNIAGGALAMGLTAGDLEAGSKGLSLMRQAAAKDGIDLNNQTAVAQWLKDGGAEQVFGPAVKAALTNAAVTTLTMGVAGKLGQRVEGLLAESRGGMGPIQAGAQDTLRASARGYQAGEIATTVGGFGGASVLGDLAAGQTPDEKDAFVNALTLLIPSLFHARGRFKESPLSADVAPKVPETKTTAKPDLSEEEIAGIAGESAPPPATGEEVAGVKSFLTPEEEQAQKQKIVNDYIAQHNEEQVTMGARAGRTETIRAEAEARIAEAERQDMLEDYLQQKDATQREFDPAERAQFSAAVDAAFDALKKEPTEEETPPLRAARARTKQLIEDSLNAAEERDSERNGASTEGESSFEPNRRRTPEGLLENAGSYGGSSIGDQLLAKDPLGTLNTLTALHLALEARREAIAEITQQAAQEAGQRQRQRTAAPEPAATRRAAATVEPPAASTASVPLIRRGRSPLERASQPAGYGPLHAGARAEVENRSAGGPGAGVDEESIHAGVTPESRGGEPAGGVGGNGEATAAEPVVPVVHAGGDQPSGAGQNVLLRAGRTATEAANRKTQADIEEALRREREGGTELDRVGNSDHVTLPEGIHRDIESGTATADRALESLAKASNSALTRVIAHALRVALRGANITIEYRPGLKTKDGRASAGKFVRNETGSHIYLNPESGANAATLMHELVHAATAHAIDNPTNATQRAAVAELQRMMEHAKNLTFANGEHYGFTDLREFVAEAMSNRQFQEALSKVSWQGLGPKQSLWQRFKDIIARTMASVFPGREQSVLHQAILRSVDLFEAPRGEGKVELNKVEDAHAADTDAARDMAKYGPGHIIGYKEGQGTTHRAYANGDGTFRLYDVTKDNPRGDPATKQPNVSEEQVYDHITKAGSTPENRTVTVGVKGNNRNMISRWHPDGSLAFTVVKQSDGKWRGYKGATLEAKGTPREAVEFDTMAEARRAADAESPHTSYQAAQDFREQQALTDLTGPNASVTPGIASRLRRYMGDQNSPQVFLGSAINALLERKGKTAPGDLDLYAAQQLKNSHAARDQERAKVREVEPLMQRTRAALVKGSKWFGDRKLGYGRIDDALSATIIAHNRPALLEKYEKGGMRYIDDDPTKGETPEYKKVVQNIADAKKHLADLDRQEPGLSKKVYDTLREWKSFSDKTIDTEVWGGRMSPVDAAKIKAAYQVYGPIRAEGKVTKTTATGQSSKGKDILARMVEQRFDAIGRAYDNRATQLTVKWAKVADVLNPDGSKVFKIEPVDREHLVHDPETGEITVSTTPNAKNSFVYYEDGRPMRIELQGEYGKQLLEAMSHIKGSEHSQAVRTALGYAGFYTRMFSALHTSLSPAFAVRNFLRDYVTNVTQLNPKIGYGALHQAMLSPAVWAAAFRHGYHAAAKTFGKDSIGKYSDAEIQQALTAARAGKANGTQMTALVEHYQPLIEHRSLYGAEQAVDDYPIALRPSLMSKASEYLAPADGRLTNFISGATHSLESVNRIAVFKAGLESGMSPEQAAVAAKNSTTNFERRGALSSTINPFYAFANAKMQGARTLGENLGFSPLKGQGTGDVKQALKGLAGGKLAESANPRTVRAAQLAIALGLGAAYANYKSSDKDPDGRTTYGKRNEYQLDEYLHIPGTNVDLPIPQELGTFYNMGSTLGDKFFGDRAGAASSPAVRFATALIQNFWPGGTSMHDPIGTHGEGGDYVARLITPTQLTPFLDAFGPMDTFGRKVNPQRDRTDIPPEMQGAAGASPTANTLAQGLAKSGVADVSPRVIDHLLLSLFQQQRDFKNAITDGNVGALLHNVFKSESQTVFPGTNRNDYDAISQELKMQAAREAGNPLKAKQYTGLAKDFAQTDNKLKSLATKWNKAKTSEEKQRIDKEEDSLRMQVLKKYYEQTGVTRPE